MKKPKLILVIIFGIINLNIVVAQISITNFQAPSSIGESDGYIEITSENIELGPFTVSKNGEPSVEFASSYVYNNLAEGVCNFSITDNFGCVTTLSHDLKIDCSSLDIVFYNVIRPNECDTGSCLSPYFGCDQGSFNIEVVGSENYSVYVNEVISGTNTSFTNLVPGIYEIRLIDNVTLCEKTEEIDLKPCSVDGVDCNASTFIPDLNNLGTGGFGQQANLTSSISLNVQSTSGAGACDGSITIFNSANFDNTTSVVINRVGQTEQLFTGGSFCAGFYNVNISNGCETETRTVEVGCFLDEAFQIEVVSPECSQPQTLQVNADPSVYDITWYINDNPFANEFNSNTSTIISKTQFAEYTGGNRVYVIATLDGCTTRPFSYPTYPNNTFMYKQVENICTGSQFGSITFHYTSVENNPNPNIQSFQGPSSGIINFMENQIQIEQLVIGNYDIQISLDACVFDFNFDMQVEQPEPNFLRYDEDNEECVYRFLCNDEYLPASFNMSFDPSPLIESQGFTGDGTSLADISAQFFGVIASFLDVSGGGFFGNILRSIGRGKCRAPAVCIGNESEVVFIESDIEGMRVHEYQFILQVAAANGFDRRTIGLYESFLPDNPCNEVQVCVANLEPVRITEGHSGALGNIIGETNPCNVACGSLIPSNAAACDATEELLDNLLPDIELPCFNFTTVSLAALIKWYNQGVFDDDFEGTDLDNYLDNITKSIDNDSNANLCIEVTYCVDTRAEFNFPSVDEIINSSCTNSAVIMACGDNVPTCNEIINDCTHIVLCNPSVQIINGNCEVMYVPVTLEECGNSLKSLNPDSPLAYTALPFSHSIEEEFLSFQRVQSNGDLYPRGKIAIEDGKYILTNVNNGTLSKQEMGQVDNFAINYDVDGMAMVKNRDGETSEILFAKDTTTVIRSLEYLTDMENIFVSAEDYAVYIAGFATGDMSIDGSTIYNSNENYVFIFEYDYSGLIQNQHFIPVGNYQVKGFSSIGENIGFYAYDGNNIELHKANGSSNFKLTGSISDHQALESFELTEIGWLIKQSAGSSIIFSNETISAPPNKCTVSHVNFAGNTMWTKEYNSDNANISIAYAAYNNSIYVSTNNVSSTSSVIIEKFQRETGGLISDILIDGVEAELNIKEIFPSNNGNLYLGGDLKSTNDIIHLKEEVFVNSNVTDRSIAIISHVIL